MKLIKKLVLVSALSFNPALKAEHPCITVIKTIRVSFGSFLAL